MSRSACLVAAVWFLTTASTFWLVARYSLTSPMADELRYVGIVTGAEPLTWRWFFQVENQHCAPVFKAAYLGLGWTTGFDFRAGALANVGLLALLSLAMIVGAARMRGRSSALDVIFPILLLHWGHYGNLIWGFQLFYVLPTVLAGIVLVIVATSGRRLSIRSASLVAACLLGAGLCGGPGVFYVPPLAAWLGYAGVLRWRDCGQRPPRRSGARQGGLSGSVRNATDGVPYSSNGAGTRSAPAAERRAGAGMLVLAAIACLPLAAYVVARAEALRFPPPLEPTSEGPLAGTLAFLGLGVGKIGKELWPLSGLVVAALLAAATVLLYRRWRSEPHERLPAAGLWLFLGGGVLLALGIGVARGHMAPRACLQYRYMILAAPLILCLYWIGVRYGPAIRSRQLRAGLAATMLVLAGWYNARGWNLAAGMREPIVELETAAASGMPPRELAVRFAEALQDPPDSLRAHLKMLQQARLGPYRNAPLECGDPPPLSFAPPGKSKAATGRRTPKDASVLSASSRSKPQR